MTIDKPYSLILNSAKVSVLTITILLESWKLDTIGGSSDNELLLLSLSQQFLNKIVLLCFSQNAFVIGA